MGISAIVTTVLNLIPAKYLKGIGVDNFIPDRAEMEQITHYFLDTRPSLKNEAVLKQQAELLKIPYLKYLGLDQIDHWEKNYNGDIQLLLNLYVAQSFFAKGLKRVIWDKNTETYYYIDSIRGIGGTRSKAEKETEASQSKYKLEVHSCIPYAGLMFFSLAFLSATFTPGG